jgi:hypothetical protein
MTVKTFKQAVHPNDQSLQPLSRCIYVPSLSVSMETVKQLIIEESAEFKLTLSGQPKGGDTLAAGASIRVHHHVEHLIRSANSPATGCRAGATRQLRVG